MTYDLKTLHLTPQQYAGVLEWYACKMFGAAMAAELDDGYCKSYDPLTIEIGSNGVVAHSYVFDFHDGGRHHRFESLDALEEGLDKQLLLYMKEPRP